MTGHMKKILRGLSLGLIVACSGISVFLAGVIVRKAAFFAIREVVLEGAETFRERESGVRAVTDPFIGQNLFSVDTALLRWKLLELPWVKDAEVARRFPSLLRVRLKGRRAVAFLHTHTELGPRLFLVDAEGVLLDEPVGLLYPEGPVITGLEVKNPFLGRTVEMAELRQLLSVLAELKERRYPFYAELQEIRMENSLGLARYRVLFSSRNMPVRSDRLDRRTLEDLEALLAHYGSAARLQRLTVWSNTMFVEERI